MARWRRSALAAAPPPTRSSPIRREPPPSIAIAPYEFHEECAQLAPGDRLDYRFEAKTPVAFQIYYKEGITYVATVSRDDVTEYSGVFQAKLLAALLPALGSRPAGRAGRLPHSLAAGGRIMTGARRALLFDLDGTLTDNYLGISRSIVYALERMSNAVPDEAAFRRCMGPPLRESFAWLLDTDDAEAIERAIGLYRERYADVGWRENVVYEGVEQALAALAEQSPIYLCTSKPEVYARRIVTLFGLAEHFKGIYGADLEGRLDDKVKLFAHIAVRESIEPEQAIMIGDRAHDLRAARMNGARCVGVLWGYGSREELAGADAIAAAPEELASAVSRASAKAGSPPASPSR